MKNWILFFIAALTFLSIADAARIMNNLPEIRKVYNADIIIYGGTSAAIIAAVEVAKSGKTVFIVSPDLHLGGLSSGGFSSQIPGIKQLLVGFHVNFIIEYGYIIKMLLHGNGKIRVILAIKVKEQSLWMVNFEQCGCLSLMWQKKFLKLL